jgi:hypothetical protein
MAPNRLNLSVLMTVPGAATPCVSSVMDRQGRLGESGGQGGGLQVSVSGPLPTVAVGYETLQPAHA